jgi:23S rRNA (cytosine1962-C5)-methyltransferase
MRIASGWEDFELLDASNGEKLERWGQTILIRPDPQVLWNGRRSELWDAANARFTKLESGKAGWQLDRLEQKEWEIGYRTLRFRVGPTGFKHMGLFPEQAVNWDLISRLIVQAQRPVEVLNLFAYTGAATLASADAGARVVHVDAAKPVVQWARENQRISGLSEAPVRWIVDDCKKFLLREIKRGRKYQGIVMDPPSYGRGPAGEIWKLENGIDDLVKLAVSLLSDDAVFFILNSYTTGLSDSVMGYILALHTEHRGGEVSFDEIGLRVSSTGLVLPQGATAVWTAR